MMDVNDVLEMWKQDSRISESQLDTASAQAASNHSKYLDILVNAKLAYRKAESKYKQLETNKWLWYTGKMTKDQMDDLGWDYDPLKNHKVLKSDISRYLEADSDLIEAKDRIEYYKVLVATIEEIINQIRFRPTTIKNMIEWRKFEAGI